MWRFRRFTSKVLWRLGLPILILGKEEFELARLARLPRYQEGETKLLGEKLRFVDSHTFVSGYREIFQRRIYDFATETERPYIIDCGVNIGLSSIFFKQLYPNSSVLAFEADPQIYKTCMYNLSSLHIKSVELRNRAVWYESGQVPFHTEGGYSGRIAKPGDTHKNVDIQAIRLSDLLDRDVDFLKIDIEGAEHKVILDCAHTLGNVRNIFIEYHSHVREPQKLDEILAILSRVGFRYHIHEAFTVSNPYRERGNLLGMDLQLNIFGFRSGNAF